MNWKKNNGKVISGRDRNGDPVLGTPGAQNSNDQIYTIFSGSFGIDTLLKKDMNPYLFCGTVQVFQNNILEFEPGTVIKFCDNSSMLYVKGTLKALGTEGDKITFTSFRDDEATGDTNQDGVTTAPAPGDWVSIYFSKESSGSELENVVVKYGGATVGFSPSSYGAGIWVDSSVIFLKNSLIAQNKNRGMMLINSASVVDSVVFSNNDKQNTGSKAIEIQGGNPSIENCQFLQNYYGVFISSYSSSPEIKNNYFEKNLSPILLGSQSQPVFSGNTAFENTYNAIILGGDVQGSLTLPLDLPYLIKFSSFTVNENAVLNIGPGVVIDFLSQAQLVVRGTLKALGSAENPVVFKPYDDANPLPGAWPGIIFLSTSTGSELENVDIKYAGQLFGGTTAGAIRVDRSIISLKNSVLENNANSGLWLINSSSVIDSVRFLNHAKAVYIQGGSPEIKNSYFENQDYGVYEDSWADGQGNIIFPTPNLHAEEGDPEQNTFVASKKADIFNASAP